MGGRSAKAVALLREHGITNVRNLKGGILAWIDKVDPTQSSCSKFQFQEMWKTANART